MAHGTESGSKTLRGNASQFFVAGELCRRGLIAVITMGNCPNTDILVSNVGGTEFAHVQVKTFVPGNRTCSVGEKAEKPYGKNFYWVVAGIPERDSKAPFQFYVIPAEVMSAKTLEVHKKWLETPGKKGQKHKPTKMRTVHLPPGKNRCGWSIDEYRDRWDLIENCVR
ncbi:MAG: hypothetical protein IT461_01925 [Planctomycetes bacterium]|nr:hypothetical protein [Planctomycetota bacterium]